MWRSMIKIALAVVFSATACAAADSGPGSPPMDEIFSRAQEMIPGVQREEHALLAVAPGACKGASCAATNSDDGRLEFKIAQTNAVIAVRNMESGQVWPWHDGLERAARVTLPFWFKIDITAPADMTVEVCLTHPDAASHKIIYSPAFTFSLTQGVNTVAARRPVNFTCPAGIQIKCAGGARPGQSLQIDKISFSADVWSAYFRRELVLPADDPVWRAIGSVEALGGQYYGNNTLYINGREAAPAGLVRKFTFHTQYNIERVDIAPWLRPGTNSIELCVRMAGNQAFAYGWFQGAVVLNSGRQVLLDSGAGWKWRADGQAEWAELPVWNRGQPALAGYVPSGTAGNDRRFTTKIIYDRPASDGRLVVEHPADNKLFFRAETNATVAVRIPSGYAGAKPEVKWELLHYVHSESRLEPAHADAVDKFSRQDDSLVFRLELPALPPGIYLLQAALECGGKLVEQNDPEPLVFLAPLKMEAVAGDSYEQGMDLELETTVDFTNPADPHPSIETDAAPDLLKTAMHKRHVLSSEFISAVETPAIVERHGLKYRETSTNNWAQFSCLVEFQHPGDFYLLALEYPDDAERWMAMACIPSIYIYREPTNAVYDNIPNHLSSKCAPGVWTGGKYPVSNRMLDLKWLYVPDPGAHALNLINLKPGCAAAASQLKIYHVRGRLPALATPALPLAQQRKIGQLTEADYANHPNHYLYLMSGRGFYKNFACSWQRADVFAQHRRALGAKAMPVLEMCALLAKYKESCERFAEYMRFAGLNLHVMGCLQYNNENTPYLSPDGSARLTPCLRDFAARVFDVNDIAFLASVEFMHTTGLKARRQRGETNLLMAGSTVFDFRHPDVEREMLRVADELGEKFKYLPGFMGINWTADGIVMIPAYGQHNTCHRKGDACAGYDDAEIDAFEKETGMAVPVSPDDPDRRFKRQDYLNAPERRDVWLQWRAGRFQRFFRKVAEVLKAKRPDLICHASPHFYYDTFIEWRKAREPFADFIRGRGWDAALYDDASEIRFTPWACAAAEYVPAYTWGHMRRIENYAAAWQANADMDFYAAFQMLPYRSIMLRHWWVEVEHAAGMLPFRPGWPRPFQSTCMTQQRADYAREPYTQAMIGFDPQTIMFGFNDATLYTGEEQPLREFIPAFRSLPAEPFEPALGAGFSNNIAVRSLRRDDGYYFYAANPGYWPLEGAVIVAGAGQIIDLASGKVVAAAPGSTAGTIAVPVKLKPYGLAAFKAEAPGAEIIGCENQPVAEADLAHMRGIIDAAGKMLRNEDFKQFPNYGFIRRTTESAGQALQEGRYALAWSLLINDEFWDTVFRKGPRAAIEAPFEKILAEDRSVTVVRLDGNAAPALDGKLDDALWQAITPLQGFMGIDKKAAADETKVYLAHDGENIYIAFDCRDQSPDRIKSVAKHELDVSRDDVAAVFLRPDGGTTYYQLAVNPAGVKLDQKCTPGGKDYIFDAKWEAVAARHDHGWSVEMKVPAHALDAAITPGAGWKVNFHRGYAGNRRPAASWSWNADWHDLERQGLMVFAE